MKSFCSPATCLWSSPPLELSSQFDILVNVWHCFHTAFQYRPVGIEKVFYCFLQIHPPVRGKKRKERRSMSRINIRLIFGCFIIRYSFPNWFSDMMLSAEEGFFFPPMAFATYSFSYLEQHSWLGTIARWSSQLIEYKIHPPKLVTVLFIEHTNRRYFWVLLSDAKLGDIP